MKLDILSYADRLKLKSSDGKSMIWDMIRSKWLVLTPEEMVRQCLVHYLIEEKKMSKNKIALERVIMLGNKKKRFDVLIYDELMRPDTAIECKSPDIALDEKVVSQVVRYNKTLDCKFLWVVNGVEGKIYSKSIDGFWVQD